MIRINKYIAGIAAGLALLLAACTQQENIDSVENNQKITIHFDVPGSGVARTAETISAVEGREALLNVIDVFFFAGSDATPAEDASVVHHERVTGTGADYTLQAGKNNFTNTHVVYVLANVPDSDAEKLAAVQTYGDLKDLKLENDICNPYGSDAYLFLMDGKSEPTQISTADKVDVTLKRAAAKVDVVLSLPTDWGTTPAEERFTWATNNLSSGYWVNPPKTVFLSAEKDIQGQDIIYGTNTPVQNQDAVDHTHENSAKRRLVLYSYPATWQGGDYDHETYLILNLPISIGGVETTANYYKVRINQATSGTLSIDRNKHYRINITVGTKGSTTPDEAVELSGRVGVYDWIGHDINIGDGDDTMFLVLSEEAIEFYNTEENQIVEYASSSPITDVHIKGTVSGESNNDAPYYYDQFGQKQRVNNTTYPTKASVTTDGHIKIESTLLKNCAPKHYTVVVINQEGIKKEFNVVQYPLEYITSEQSFQSYRKDVKKNNEVITYENIERLEVSKEDTYYRFDRFFGFYNKYVLKNTERGGRHDLAYNYYWNTWGSKISYSTQSSENARIYHITITRTSSDYVLAIPSVANDGTTATDKDNQEKVSPSFMIASRLGSFENNGRQGADYEWAKKHCNNYVEVTEDGTIYDDWRLPTPAELKIIFTYQLSRYGSVIDELLIANYNYWGSGAAVRYDGRNKPEVISNATRGAIRCVRDAYRNTEPQN